MSRRALALYALSLLAVFLATYHRPVITVVDRAKPDEIVSTRFITGNQLRFPKIDSHGKNYWIIFDDQTPCKPAEGANPKAYFGTPTQPPICIIAFRPQHNRDRLYRYALVPAEENNLKPTPPPAEIPYFGHAGCRPICNDPN